MDSELETLPNIGSTLAKKLSTIGIDSQSELQAKGAEDTFIKLMTVDEHACLNMLYAIEGAIQGMRWHGLDRERKMELKEFYNSLQ